jgi:hypothetical protein
MILYLEDPKDSTKKLVNIYNRIQNQHMKINNEQVEKEIRKSISFTIASKRKSRRNKFNGGGYRPLQ